MTQRTDWVDYAKGFGIILVVYEHLLSSGYHAGLVINEHYFQLSEGILSSFLMPLFFFLAGIFARQSYEKSSAKFFFVNKIQLLAYPYLLWSFLQISAELTFTSHSFNGPGFVQLLAIPFLPWAQFWFLYALLDIYIVYGLFRMLPKYSSPLLAFFALYLFFRPINTEIMALSRLSSFLIFFVFGVLAKKYFAHTGNAKIPSKIILISLMIFAGSGGYLFEHVLEPTRLRSESHPLYFLFLATFGTMGCIGVAQYLADKNWCGFFKIIGRHSLQIYLAHMLVGVGTRIILLKIFHVLNPFVHIILGVWMGLLVPVILYKISLSVNVPYLFEWRKVSRVSNT